jgi:hypothetical protein
MTDEIIPKHFYIVNRNEFQVLQGKPYRTRNKHVRLGEASLPIQCNQKDKGRGEAEERGGGKIS